MGFYSILIYIALIIVKTNIVHLTNWTQMALVLLVALSIKYSNYVLKTLAISGSIIYGSMWTIHASTDR
jgi:hypothetical protein